MSKNFLKGMHPEEWRAIIKPDKWLNEWKFPDLSSLEELHPKNRILKQNEWMDNWKLPDVNKFLFWMNIGNWGEPVKEIKKKVSDILD